jgi:hypothetical protein
VLRIIKVIDPGLYEFCRAGSVSFSQVDFLMRFHLWKDEHDPQQRDRTGEDAENWWRFALGDLHDEELVRQFDRSLAPFGRSHPSMIVPITAGSLTAFHCPVEGELNRPLLPLAAALPRMLQQIEAELADVKVSAAEKWRLRQRAELMRGLLTPRPISLPSD